jgi:cytochrome P450 family 6
MIGFETSSSSISFCLYELAKNPEIQRKLQNEIDEVLLTDNKVHEYDYEKIKSMKYLAACVDEAIRKYPPGHLLNRETTNDYQIPDTNITIKKGTAVLIPLLGIHNNPDNFKDPDTFKPERFLDSKSDDNKHAFISFGEGPRKCIGESHFNSRNVL